MSIYVLEILNKGLGRDERQPTGGDDHSRERDLVKHLLQAWTCFRLKSLLSVTYRFFVSG